MNRNLEIEKRIMKRTESDKLLNRNSYGGMGMDMLPCKELDEKKEELQYIQLHPEIYNKQQKYVSNKLMYLISLN